MLLGFTNNKKLPRLFLIQGLTGSMPSLKGVKIQWPFELSHLESDVLDLSLSGLAAGGAGVPAKLKLGQSFEIKLKVESVRDPVMLKVRVVRQQAGLVGLALESISAEGRLTLDQVVKDRMVTENLHLLSPTELSSEFHSAKWFHGPFDTNFFVWLKEDGSLKAALVEYDHLVWIYQEGKVTLQKTGSATDENKGYFETHLLDQDTKSANKVSGRSGNKVSMGASWLDRLLKVLNQVSVRPESAQPELQALTLILRHQRNQ